MLYFLRDDSNNLLGFTYKNKTYYYKKNAFDDIIGIYDSNYKEVCTYNYDAYGNILSIKDSAGKDITDTSNVAIINPFRYRSYYYDTETNLYYLNSRYYSPSMGRFINCDGYISTNTGVIGFNMYTYCNNNGINNIDIGGNFLRKLIGWLFKKNTTKQTDKAMKEISNVQTQYNVCPLDDEEFHKLLKNNASKAEKELKKLGFIKRSLKLIELVDDKMVYDLKRQPEWKNKTICYDGLFMEPQDLGNYHFGYVGRAAGFSTDYLLFGASVNQLKKIIYEKDGNYYFNSETFKNCFTSSLCDDPRNQYFVRLGAIAYDKENS